jgi:hypothetical protein
VKEFDGEAVIQGTYAEQPPYVKLAALLAYLSCIDLLIFVPISVGAAVIGGVGTPATTQSGRYGPFIFLLGMLAIGAWVNNMGLNWLSANRMRRRLRWLIFGMLCVGSAGASALFILAHIWPLTFLCIVAFVPVGLLIFFVAARVKQFLRGV